MNTVIACDDPCSIAVTSIQRTWGTRRVLGGWAKHKPKPFLSSSMENMLEEPLMKTPCRESVTHETCCQHDVSQLFAGRAGVG